MTFDEWWNGFSEQGMRDVERYRVIAHMAWNASRRLSKKEQLMAQFKVKKTAVRTEPTTK